MFAEVGACGSEMGTVIECQLSRGSSFSSVGSRLCAGSSRSLRVPSWLRGKISKWIRVCRRVCGRVCVCAEQARRNLSVGRVL